MKRSSKGRLSNSQSHFLIEIVECLPQSIVSKNILQDKWGH